MAHNYIVTAQKSTAVMNCLSGNFTSPYDLNLILDKLNRIEVYLVTSDGLRILKEIPFFARIQLLKPFRLPNTQKDLLFVLSAKYNAFILEFKYEKNEFEVITLSHGYIFEKIGRPSENGSLCIFHPKSKMLVLRLYDGLLNVIKLDLKSTEIKSYNIRIDETIILDMAFLAGFDKPVFSLIYQDIKCRHLKTYEITEDNDLKRGPWKQENIESESNILISVPEPYNGVIVIGQESIVYVRDNEYFTAIAPPLLAQSSVTCYCKLDGNRYLIGDMDGRLSILILAQNDHTQRSSLSLKHIYLGEVSIPIGVTYLDNNYVFIASKYGDSQLIRIGMDSCDTGNYVEVVTSYVNLAPIMDMLVVDLDKQGQDQLVTCSGYSKEGSIKLIRNGIGINEHATIDLPDIKGIWQLKVNSTYDNTIVVSFVCQTKLLKIENEEVEQIVLSGFDISKQTLYCGNIESNPDIIIQATSSSITLICTQKGKVIFEWKPSNNISLISTNGNQIICSSNLTLYYLEIVGLQIDCINQVELEFEVSCLDLSPLLEPKSKICAIGLWKDISVRTLSLPDLKTLNSVSLDGEIIPRSVLMAHFDSLNYLFIAIGDGSLLYYTLDENSGLLSEKKKVILGTQPTHLKKFISNSSTNIFACSDRPTVIYSSNNKLVFSNVNLKEVTSMCSFNSQCYPESLILVNESRLLIGQIDQIQKLHIRSVPLGETPYRICYQETTQTFGVITSRTTIPSNDGQVLPTRNSASCSAQNVTYSSSLPTFVKSTFPLQNEQNETQVYHLLIIDQTTFEILHAHQFMANEQALSIVSTRLGEDPNTYFIVGTAFIHPEEMEPASGRVIVFHLNDGKLQQVAEKEITGAPFKLIEFNGKLLVGINSNIRLFEWTLTHELHCESSFHNFISVLQLKAKGDFILVGDLIRSLTLLCYKSMNGNFEKIASEYETSWMSAMEIIDDDTFIGADSHFNLFVVHKDCDTSDNDSERLLSTVGLFHLGDYVNVMNHGSLVMNYPCEMTYPLLNKPILYGTSSGAIGLIAQIPEKFYTFLLQLQTNLAKNVKSAGNIEYDFWRSFHTENKTEPLTNFIDGDLIESFLDLDRSQMTQSLQHLKIEETGSSREASVDDIIKIVEEMSRIH